MGHKEPIPATENKGEKRFEVEIGDTVKLVQEGRLEIISLFNECKMVPAQSWKAMKLVGIARFCFLGGHCMF